MARNANLGAKGDLTEGTMRLLVSACLATLAVFQSGSASAQLTAICSDVAGRTVGYQGQQRVDAPDGFRGSVFSFLLSTVQMGAQAQIIAQSSAGAGSTPQAETGLIVNLGENLVSILVVYDHSTWTYNLMPVAGRGIFTKISNGYALDRSGAAGYVFTATCRFSGAR